MGLIYYFHASNLYFNSVIPHTKNYPFQLKALLGKFAEAKKVFLDRITGLA